jgi:hypothetical protein
MNMTTSIDNIPLKTNNNDIPDDDSDDPMVKNILDEFQQEFTNHKKPIQPAPYIINNTPSPPPPYIPPPIPNIQTNTNKSIKSNYYNEEFMRKTAIIVIIIAFIFSPIIFSTLIEKLPLNIATIIENYNFYIKLIISFIVIYLFFYYNLL